MPVTETVRGMEHSPGNAVSTIVVAPYVWCQMGARLIRDINVYSLHCTPETNTTMSTAIEKIV